MSYTVNKKCRRTVDAASDPAHEILPDALAINSSFQLLNKPFNVELKHFSEADKVPAVECLLVFKQQIVHRPKTPLSSGSLRCFGRPLCVRVNLSQRKMTKHEANILSQ